MFAKPLFPPVVNEFAARIVAAGVLTMGLLAVAFQYYWILFFVAYGFLARVGFGPRFSPLALFATRLVAPRFPQFEKLVPGSPKRFAQGIGFAVTLSALVAHFVFGATEVAMVLVIFLCVAAFLEAVLAFCLGCLMFNWLMRIGVIPESICEECSDLSRRLSGES